MHRWCPGSPLAVRSICVPVGLSCSCACPLTPVALSAARNVRADGPELTTTATATTAVAASAKPVIGSQRRVRGRLVRIVPAGCAANWVLDPGYEGGTRDSSALER